MAASAPRSACALGSVRSGVPSGGPLSVGPTCTSSVTRWCGARSATSTCAWCRRIAIEHGRVRHRVLRTLGREDELKASGQLEQLMGSFARLDPPLVGMRREVGPMLLAAHFLGELDLVATIDRALPQRGRQQLSAGEVAAALIASRLCSPSPLYDIAGWASGTALQELIGIPPALLNDDRLGRGAGDAGRLRRDAARRAGRPRDRALRHRRRPPARRPDDAARRRRLRGLSAGGQGLGARPPGRAPGPGAAGHQRLRRLAVRAPRSRQRRRGRADRRVLGTPQANWPPRAW